MLRPSCSLRCSRSISNIFKSWKCCKQQTDCAKPTETPKYVIAKSCCPSIFESWKPKVPDLNALSCPPIKESMTAPYKLKTCMAGMKCQEKNRCELEAEARLRQKMNHPKWIWRCPPKPKYKVEEPLPPLKSSWVKCKESKGKIEKKIPTTIRKKCEPEVPEPDWNIDGHLN